MTSSEISTTGRPGRAGTSSHRTLIRARGGRLRRSSLGLQERGITVPSNSPTFDGSTWSASVEVPGNGSTFQTPTAAVYGNRLWLFVTGTNNRLHRNIYNGLAWSGWSRSAGERPDAERACRRRLRQPHLALHQVRYGRDLAEPVQRLVMVRLDRGPRKRPDPLGCRGCSITGLACGSSCEARTTAST